VVNGDGSQRRQSRWEQNAKTIVLALALAFGVRIGIAQAYEIEGPSMEPTVFQDERVLVARCAYGLSLPGLAEALFEWSGPQAGEVVIVESLEGLDLVKRVIGVAGDVIAIEDGVVIRNGEPVVQVEVGQCDPARQLEPDPSCRIYTESIGSRTWRISRSALDLDSMDAIRVPPGQVFVVGDHRDRSNDSRFFGPIPTSRLRGRVLLVD
jgi:signal peptidase I